MKLPAFISHRGANRIYPENTMAAFKEAYRLGLNWIELDVQLSEDNVLFIFHDDNAKRLTGDDRQIRSLSWPEIARLSVSEKSLSEKGAFPIPNLREYLNWMATAHDLYSNIELKIAEGASHYYQKKLLIALFSLLDDYPRLTSRILLSSFSPFIVNAIAKSRKALALGLLVHVESWNKISDKMFDAVKTTYHNARCCFLGINDRALDREKVDFLQRNFGHLAIYGDDALSDDAVKNLRAINAGSVFIDDVNQLRFLSDFSGRKKANHRSLSVGFLATGDEMTTGDVLNTNTPKLAETLYAMGFRIGFHIASNDQKHNIVTALQFLLARHDIVITVGGLGPTEDDKTAEAIAEVSDCPLVYNEPSWQRICTRVKKHFSKVPENNKKQAYFPKGAQVLANHEGTADGCYLKIKAKQLVMLPGPPHECFSMFDRQVLPMLKKCNPSGPLYRYHWNLLGASEAKTADTLAPVAQKFDVNLAYRAAYPYLEIKFHTDQLPSKTNAFVHEIDQLISPYVATREKARAGEILARYFNRGAIAVTLKKDVTKGHLHSRLALMAKKPLNTESMRIQLSTEGMDRFWQKAPCDSDEIQLQIKLKKAGQSTAIEKMHSTRFYIRGTETFHFIFEWVCAQLIEVIEKAGNHDE